MRARVLITVVVVAATLITPHPCDGQGRDPQLFLGFGSLVYDGASDDSGVGIAGRVQYQVTPAPRLRVGIELGVHALSTLGQTCALGVPSACSPVTPASPVWHLRAEVSPDLFRPFPLYLTTGLGLYGPVGPADRPRDIAAGVDVGFGIGLSPHVALEASYLNLRTERYLGHSIALGVKIRL